MLMPIINFNNLIPKFCNLWKAKIFSKIYKVQNIFLKQLPPKPGLESKNFEPILLSDPIALETSLTFAPVASQIALIEFIELIPLS